jgi:hypothetical protein
MDATCCVPKLGFYERTNSLVCTFSPNHIDYPIAVWAVHQLCAVVSYVAFLVCLYKRLEPITIYVKLSQYFVSI